MTRARHFANRLASFGAIALVFVAGSCGRGVDTRGGSVRPPPRLLYSSNAALSGIDTEPAVPTQNIWIVNSDGTGRSPLTQYTIAMTGSFAPAPSPDGKKVAYHSYAPIDGVTSLSSNIWVMNSDGSDNTPLTKNLGASLDSTKPSFSPDGTRIAYVSKAGVTGLQTGGGNLYVMNADGTGKTALTSATTSTFSICDDAIPPQFSPDGATLLVYSKMGLGGDENQPVVKNNIWTLSATDGTHRVPVTQLNNGANTARNAVLSPDGKKISFMSNMDLPGAVPASSLNIWISDLDGTHQVPLTQNALGLRDSSLPAFSPDGLTVSFFATLNLSNPIGGTPGSVNIWTVITGGSSTPTPLTQDVNASASYYLTIFPIFSPESTPIAYLSQESLDTSTFSGTAAGLNLWVVNPDGTGRTPLTRYGTTGPMVTSFTRPIWLPAVITTLK